MSARRNGFTDDDDAICKIMMARWEDRDVEGKPVGASKVASFADMARAVRESDWLAKRDAEVRAAEREAVAVAIEAQAQRESDQMQGYGRHVTIQRISGMRHAARIARAGTAEVGA